MSSPAESRGDSDLIDVQGTWQVEYQYTAGRMVSEFFTRLRDRKTIYGTVCPSCETVFLPPRETCAKCYVATEGWVECGSRGVITAWTINFEPFDGSPPVPYAIAMVRLEGATTSIANLIDIPGGTDLERDPPFRIGDRVRTRFVEHPTGSIGDFRFELDETGDER